VRYIFVFLLGISVVWNSHAQRSGYLDEIRAWEQKPPSGEKFLQLARLYEQTGNYGKAIENYHLGLTYYPDSTALLKKLARAYERYGYVRQAVKVREQIDTADVVNAYRLALLYAQINRRKKALPLLYRLEKKDPANAEFSYKIGVYETDMNRKLDAFLRAYRKDTAHIKSIRQIVRMYRMLKYRDSVDYFLTKGLQVAPDDTPLLRIKVVEAYRRQNYRQMWEDLEKLDSLGYDRLFVYKNKGVALMHLNDTDKALAYLQKASAVDFRDPGVHYYLGLLYEKLNRLDEAEKEFLIAVGLKKPDVDREYLHLGLIAKNRKDYARAIEWFQKARKNNYRNAEALFQLAVVSDVYYKDKKIALNYYEKYLEKFAGKDPEKTTYAQSRIDALKKEMFFDGQMPEPEKRDKP